MTFNLRSFPRAKSVWAVGGERKEVGEKGGKRNTTVETFLFVMFPFLAIDVYSDF